MSSGESGALDCQISRNPYLSGGAWRRHLKILSLAVLLLVEVLAMSLRFDGKMIPTGASSKSGATGQASRPCESTGTSRRLSGAPGLSPTASGAG